MKKRIFYIFLFLWSINLYSWIGIDGEVIPQKEYTFFGKYLYVSTEYFKRHGYSVNYFKDSGIVVLNYKDRVELMMKEGSTYFWINRVCYISKLPLQKKDGVFWIPAYDICAWLNLKLEDHRGEKRKKVEEKKKKIDFSQIFVGKKTAKLWEEDKEDKIKAIIKKNISDMKRSDLKKSENLWPQILGVKGQILEEGIVYYNFRKWKGKKVSVHVLEVDRKKGWEFRSVLAKNKILEKDSLAKMMASVSGIAGINGSYFDRLMGLPLGIFISRGKILSTPIYRRTAVGFKKNGEVVIGVPQFALELLYEGKKMPYKISSVNQYAKNDGVMIYTTEYGTKTPSLTDARQVVVVGGKVVSLSDDSCLIPPDGYVIVFTGRMKKYAQNFTLFSSVKLESKFYGNWNDVIFGLGAGPRLVKDGEVFITAEREHFQDDIKSGKAPRSGLGINKDGDKIYLIAVDGRRKGLPGFTLQEFARFMQTIGIYDGINLDGGGSSALVYKGRFLNKPSEKRNISNSIIVCRNLQESLEYAYKY